MLSLYHDLLENRCYDSIHLSDNSFNLYLLHLQSVLWLVRIVLVYYHKPVDTIHSSDIIKLNYRVLFSLVDKLLRFRFKYSFNSLSALILTCLRG